MGNCFLQFSHLLLAELDVKSCNVFLQKPQSLGPRNGEHIIPLVMHPGQGQLPRLAPLLLCYLFEPVHQHQVLHTISVRMSVI